MNECLVASDIAVSSDPNRVSISRHAYAKLDTFEDEMHCPVHFTFDNLVHRVYLIGVKQHLGWILSLLPGSV